MPAPKKKHSKRRKRIRHSANSKRRPAGVVKTKTGTGYKRPHFDEKIEV